MTEVRIDAFAKLTLGLRVTGVRASGTGGAAHAGYHEIESLMISVSEPHDSLVLRAAGATSVTVDGEFAAGVPRDASNLAARAAAALGVNANIAINKGIPHGAGLGGGSVDAAAVLRGLCALYELSHDEAHLARIGATLGADVPFCLLGGAARVSGIGEIIEATTIPELHVVIATPGFGCSTAAVYRAWDELGGPIGRAVETGVVSLDPLTNDLEPAALHVEPRLAEFRDTIERAAGRPALLAGSGSSYCFVVGSRSEAERAHEAVTKHATRTAFSATLSPGARLRT